ncbi:hypothetical protein [Acinetobacter sp. TTH0-4]|uniref:hypothetical protein n=1 Tax=Acinetobacter sp. TTH0-4 TaxID=1646498 RepID=UPI0009D6C883|nr:hypothetical protein [Acinetobacter sp. TTH0-4]
MTELPKKTKVNKKDGQLLIRISIAERDEFIHLCDSLDTSAAALLHKDLKCKAPLIEPNLRRNLGKWST